MKFANQIGYSDVTPYEVVGQKGKGLVVRSMSYVKDESVELEFHAGGFSAYCSNQSDQKWIIESDESAATVVIRQHKDGKWRDSMRNSYALADAPRRFYDYNF